MFLTFLSFQPRYLGLRVTTRRSWVTLRLIFSYFMSTIYYMYVIIILLLFTRLQL